MKSRVKELVSTLIFRGDWLLQLIGVLYLFICSDYLTEFELEVHIIGNSLFAGP